MKHLLKKWYFWLIILLLLGGIFYVSKRSSAINECDNVAQITFTKEQQKLADGKYGKLTSEAEQAMQNTISQQMQNNFKYCAENWRSWLNDNRIQYDIEAPNPETTSSQPQLEVKPITPAAPISNAPTNTQGSAKRSLSFAIQRFGNKVKLTVPPMEQSACIWRGTSPDYATGADIFATQSIDPQGNSHVYDYGQDVTVSALCQDKYGDSGDVLIGPINIKTIK